MDQVRTRIAAEIPRLRRYARALTGNAGTADDLVQDCLERALSRLALWRRDGNLRAWLFTIMRNLWISQVRKQANHPFDSDLDSAECAATSPPAQEDRLAVRDLAAALAVLNPEQREVVLLVGLEGLSYSEVATVIQAPIGTVMSRLSRGRERLSQLMQGAPPLRRVK